MKRTIETGAPRSLPWHNNHQQRFYKYPWYESFSDTLLCLNYPTSII